MATRSEYAQISKAVYGGQNETALNNNIWAHIDLEGKPTSGYIEDVTTINSGFQGGLYGKDANHDGIYEEIVISYRGTELSNGYLGGVSDNFDIKDIILNDISIGLNSVPAQYDSALKLYNDAVDKFGADKITITGHSLGGILTQLVCAKTGAKGVTFNAAGTKKLLPQINVNHDADFSNITNYSIENDFLSFLNVSMGLDNIGKNYIIPNTDENPFSAHCNFNALANGVIFTEEQWKQIEQLPDSTIEALRKNLKETPYNLTYINGQLLTYNYWAKSDSPAFKSIKNNSSDNNNVFDKNNITNTNPPPTTINPINQKNYYQCQLNYSKAFMNRYPF